MKLALVGIAISLIIPGQVQAEIPQIAQRINCNNPNSTVEYNYCAGESYRATDRRLNQVYQQLLGRVRGAERNQLVSAEQAWITFRDRQCEFETYQSRGGTGFSAFLSECLQRLTEQRSADLQRSIRALSDR